MGKELFPSFRDCFASVLAVKGALRRAKKRRALDRSGPLRTRSTMEGMRGTERHPPTRLRRFPLWENLIGYARLRTVRTNFRHRGSVASRACGTRTEAGRGARLSGP